jgi:hypothetical protein
MLLVPAKAPLLEEAIFNRNKAVAERRHAMRKVQHKECEIAKRDRNNNRIKRQKAREHGVSSNEVPSPEPSWSGDVANAVVDWSNMSGSSTSSPPRAIEVTTAAADNHTREERGLELAIGDSLHPRGSAGDPSSHGARRAKRPASTERPASLGRPVKAVGGVDDSIPPPL